MCDTPWKSQGQKPRPMEILLFLIDPWKFHMVFLQYCWKFHLLNPNPCLDFFWNSPVRIFCTLFICFAFDGLLQSICFRMFCSKHSITFESMYLLSCWFHCVDIFYIKFRFRETFTVINSLTRILLIETLYKLRTIKC